MTNIGNTKKKRGRPATGRDPLVSIRLPADLLAWIDDEADKKSTGRSDMVRRLIEESRLGVPAHLARLRTAFHEAGHAVVARAMGIPIVHVTIVPGDRSERYVTLGHVLNGESWWDTERRLNPGTRAKDRDSALYSHIMVLMAGREAEQMVLGFHHDTGGDRKDRRDIKRLAHWLLSENRDQVLEGLRSATMWMVMKDLPKAVTRVARALIAAKTLSQNQVNRILAVTGERVNRRPWKGYLDS